MTTTLALVVTLGVMVAWNLSVHVSRGHLLPIAGPLAAGLLLLVAWAAGLSRDQVGLGAGSMLRGLAWGGLSAAVIVIAYAVGLALPATRRLFQDQRHETLGARSALYGALLAVPLGTVVFEEVAFRGVLWGLLEVSLGPAWTAAVTSVLFGLWHVLPALDQARANQPLDITASRRAALPLVAGTVVFTAASGVVFAVLLQQSGSLFAPALLHWATNGLGVLGAALAWRLRRD